MFSIINTGLKYVDRGDISSADFNVTDYTIDQNWHDLSLAAIIPVGTKLVLIRLGIKDNAAGRWIKFRPKGYNENVNVAMLFTQVALKDFDADILVRPNADRIIQYCIRTGTWSSIVTVIRGWFI